ncbi:undecaprenyldiphospho-muramoylpentapeptide beta-N-acetylglucosaminyltransferase [candidate division WOR-1 bacterium RIFCSPHIGHO2_01_FULL_53_15]|uniref:UDP-N-acetylglucosamine--N-acetylmuramyl-(pentapeptide) pyrophosphoryl-undecaprenol N-acetylglucosamine transferase n=1 Tax=candidate division WOR-1 bacterium RIFCSPHIGHO2_01_FULL_53_15 TaxID=1802564 RepID=A0A1F4Q1K4_UNCSA|nr:MAG: undecaprenyldiphospho-muramoylpentapeptide beta-N-acetylglucosaminyltransferase [candidate division WOR-1 bacterium RIFCSPHIGHO2_01_FULL_53_15]OGC10804.1 MAG: undecaprenyldiphospho-muramoylpentapeptide beta-N-acetylglucosaminyltransferase [candidate division WOR-1 bacterium RIFCSPHIGHO2_02_FULL_53_26]
MRVAIVSGGTGGHVYPGIALADELKRSVPGAEILFLGSEEGLEKDVVPKAGYRLELIKARALMRKISYKAVSAPFVSLIGFFQALYILKKFSPRFLISTGGYASLPVVLAARCLGLPFYLQEQNVLPGFTNRLFGRSAGLVFLSFEASQRYLPGTVTGNPVRAAIIGADRGKARAKLGFSPETKVVLIIGGSQGARRMNRSVVSALPLIGPASKLGIIHLTGKRDAQMFSAANFSFYRRIDYLYNVAETLAAADLVVSRAGATAIAEFTARGLPMVLVPFPYSAEGHQEMNARLIEAAGAGIFIKDNEFTPEKFVSLVSGSALDLAALGAASKKMGEPRAAKKIIDHILVSLKK